MTELIQERRHDRILELTINRPEKKNALTVPMYQALSEAVSGANDDPDVAVILLRAAGDNFSAGNDMADFQERARADSPRPSSGLAFIEVLMACEKPVIAAVRGRAIGIGTTLLLHCDFVLADDSARFSTPFVDLGLCPEAASSFLMPLMLGFRRASDLLLAGETLGGAEARECGLVSRLYPAEALDDEARRLAQRLAAKPLASLSLSKSLLRRQWRGTIAETLDYERERFGERLRSDDCRAALDRFFNR